MDIEKVREYCIRIPGVTESLPFSEDTLVCKIFDKMFILIQLNGSNSLALKCDPQYAVELREQYNGIEPAYHFNKKYWNTVYLNADVSNELVYQLIEHSLAEVIKKLPKAKKEAYAQLRNL